MRCAIYTRKSSEEGLDQEFNSLHAQREACEAYIQSQRHEGWVAIKTAYDDGGFSGGTTDRPGLQQLLDDIRASKIDTVVVYKVDRLTRSLADFAKIVDLFDEQTVSFVSVTQAFNTTTSMGRLTLNVLLSFAQFEREVTGERIRDKIAASKKKGLWMGGNIPMGYDVKDRKLVVDPPYADIVRELFRLYINKKSTRLVHLEAQQRGYCTPIRITKQGKQRGGNPLSRGHIDQILTNRVYLGEIPHKDQSYPGDHTPIIEQDTWHCAQTVRAKNRHTHRFKTNVKSPSLLAGWLYDPNGEPMIATHANKNGKRYRYYASQCLINGAKAEENKGIRIPAGDIEKLAIDLIVRWLRDETQIIGKLGTSLTDAEQLDLIQNARTLGERLQAAPLNEQAEMLQTICEFMEMGYDQFKINFAADRLAKQLCLSDSPTKPKAISLESGARFVRIGGNTRTVIPADLDRRRNKPDSAVVRVIVLAHDWANRLINGEAKSVAAIGTQDKVSRNYVARLLPLGFLSPRITNGLLDGEHTTLLSAEYLTRKFDVPVRWDEQSIDRFEQKIRGTRTD